MSDNLGIRLKDRPPDTTAKVPSYASYWDTVTDLIENAIENLTRQGFFEGVLTSPGFSASNMVVSFNTFQCLTEDGIYCHLTTGDVTHDTADATNPRIDIICVKPTIRKDGDGEIIATGEAVIIKGTAAANPVVPDVPGGYLKVAEVDIPASATEVTLRNWKPMYVKATMLRATCQDTPDMTVKVNFFRGYVSGNTLVEKDVQNSPTFTAPATNKCKIDLLHIDSAGTLAITQGTAVDLPTEPSAPTYPVDKLVICEVYLEGGDTAIYQWQIKDVRPVLNLGVGGNFKALTDTPGSYTGESGKSAVVKGAEDGLEFAQRLGNIVEDTTPELGGDLDAKTKRIFDIKWLDLKAPTELTIASGAITITQSFHTVDTEGDGASDDLLTINGGSVGRVLILRAENDARTVVVKHNTGNIWLKGKEDLSLDDLEDCLVLVYTSGSKWVDIGAGGGGGATTFLALTDTPANYTGAGSKYCRVKATEDGLEFATPAGAGDMLKSTYDVLETGVVDKAEDLAIASQAAGDVLYFDGTNWVRLPKDVGKYLKAGASAPAWDEATIGFSFAIPIDSPGSTGTDKGVFHFAPGVAGTIDEVYIMAKTAPGTDKTLTVDVNKGGTTIFTTQANRPSLVDTATEDTSGTPDVTSFSKNDKFTVDVDVSTSGTAVADVIVLIRGKQKVV